MFTWFKNLFKKKDAPAYISSRPSRESQTKDIKLPKGSMRQGGLDEVIPLDEQTLEAEMFRALLSGKADSIIIGVEDDDSVTMSVTGPEVESLAQEISDKFGAKDSK